MPVAWIAGIASVFSTTTEQAKAQVIPTIDGAGTTVAESGEQYSIAGGTQAEGNLFHKFDQFDLAEDQTANFLSNSSVFNIVGQVSAANPSYIDGTVQVTGSDANLYLVNPSGVLFGPNAQLSLQGSFTATSADQIEFENGVLNVLEQGSDYTNLTADPTALTVSKGAAGAVVNQGNLAVSSGESLSLVGGSVVNTGSLEASGGEVDLVAVGGRSTVSLAVPGSLLSMEIDSDAIAPNLNNTFTAHNLPELLTGTGEQTAQSLTINADGSVTLGSRTIESGTAAVSGTLSAASSNTAGGSITVLGESVTIDNATINASGESGGTVRIGGDLRGEGNLITASNTTVDSASIIRADGSTTAGGNIVIWADDTATVQGSLSAQGATEGGFIETSAHYIDISDAQVTARGETASGTWLVDPVDIEIVGGIAGVNQISDSTIESAINANTNFEVTTLGADTENGDITLSTDIISNSSGTGSLTLTSRRFENTGGHRINLAGGGDLTFNLNAVNAESTTDGSSVENAIESIGFVPGAREINLGAGNYELTEAIDITTDVSIQGAGAENTLLTTVLAGVKGIRVDSDVSAAIRDVTVTTSRLSTNDLGGGVTNRGTLLVEDSHFIDNRAIQNGGAIDSFNGGALTVRDSLFRENRTGPDGSGGAIHLGNASGLNIIENTLFEGNRANRNGGALSVSNSTIRVENNTRFINNTAINGGGASIFGAGRTDIVESSFSSNVAESNGGALTAWNNATVNFDSSTLSNNQANSTGGALSLFDGTYQLTNTTLQSNEAASNNTDSLKGGGIFAQDSQLTLNNTDVIGNTAQGSGGGLHLNQVTADIRNNSRILENKSPTYGGGIYASDGTLSVTDSNLSRNASEELGGALYASNNNILTLNNTLFTDNSASTGGAIALFTPNASDTNSNFISNSATASRGAGGAIYVGSSGSFTGTTTNFSQNVATNAGGAIAIFSNPTPVSLARATFSNNSAATGGGIATWGNALLNINNTAFSQNQATAGSGGGISQAGGNLTIEGFQIAGNTASADGGGLAISGDATTTISQGTFLANDTAENGGGIAKSGTEALTVDSVSFRENSAGLSGGGIFEETAADFTLINSTLINNKTGEDGGALSLGGGGINTLDGLGIVDNTAQRDAGAIHLREDDTVTINGVNISRNQAGRNGGAIANTSSSGQITVTNANLSDNSATNGGAIYSTADSILSLTSIGIERNAAAADGGALYIGDRSGLTTNRVGFNNNSAGDQGGALYYSSSRSADIDAIFRENAAISDGGAIANNGSTGDLNIQNSAFISNTSQEDGGALFSNRSTTTINNTRFVSNRAEGIASQGGALAIMNNSTVSITDTEVRDNLSTKRGAGLFVNRNGTATVTGTVNTNADGSTSSATTQFVNNTAGRDGGGIAAVDNSQLTIRGALFSSNTSGDDGGGVAVTEISRATIENAIFENNVAAEHGGGLYSNNVTDTPLSDDKITLTNSQFVGNRANLSGGGFHQGINSAATVDNSLFRDNEAAVDGGGIHVSEGQLVVNSSQLTENRASYGAGLEVSSGGAVVVSNTSFSSNRSSFIGGGAQADRGTTLQINSSTFETNTAESGGGLFNLGDTQIVNSTFSGNTVSRDGGAIHTYSADALLDIRSSTITANSANAVGGGILNTNSQSVQLQNTIVANNESPSSADVNGDFVDAGNNLIGSNEGANGFNRSLFVGSRNNRIDPKLGPLADNGGPTKTHLLLADSVAINTGNSLNLPTADQRGLARLFGSEVDIGAVELSALEAPATSTGETIQSEFNSLLDPTLSNASFGELEALLARRIDHNLESSEVTVRQLEQSLSQGFEDYWDLSTGPDLTFTEVQAILRRAQEEYEVNSAVIYAIFAPEISEEEREETSSILKVEPEPSDNDLLNLSVVLPEGELVRYELPVTRKEVSRQARYFRTAASDPIDNRSYRPLAHQMYQWLLAPIEEDLAAQNVQNLMYALDDGLRTTPITAMRDYEGYSLERYGISVVPSMGLMQADFPVSVRRSTIAMGVSEFPNDTPLPAVPVELEVVDQFVPVSQTVLNEETTLSALKGVQALEQPGVLHLATHAIFNRRTPEDSYIHLWNEPLSMKEFSTLDWKESDLEMLILSACFTAMGSRNAELGFAGLAAASGVDATVGSLWDVSDVGTLALMSEFYAQLEANNLRFESLRQAQLALLNGETRIENGNLVSSHGVVELPDEWNLPESATLDHPFFWSAFTMVGNPW